MPLDPSVHRGGLFRAAVFLLCSEEEDAHLLQPPESLGHVQLENRTVYVWSPVAGECSVSCGRGEAFLCCREVLFGCRCEFSAWEPQGPPGLSPSAVLSVAVITIFLEEAQTE